VLRLEFLVSILGKASAPPIPLGVTRKSARPPSAIGVYDSRYNMLGK
jgi:hypothetical protein